jgi:hypothetical protein
MTTLIVILLVVWALYSGWRFYKQVNWDEPPVSTPDVGALRKREAELLHIQGFLEEAHAHGKLSQGLLDEFNGYYEAEVAALRAAAAKR